MLAAMNMSRRQFLSAAIVFVAAWVTGLGRKELRRLFRRAVPYEPLGLLDCTVSSSLHGLNSSTVPNWDVQIEAGPRMSGVSKQQLIERQMQFQARKATEWALHRIHKRMLDGSFA